jgi:hypothetical protein
MHMQLGRQFRGVCRILSSYFAIAQSEMRLATGLDGPDANPGRGQVFSFTTASRPALGPTHHPIQWYTMRPFSSGKVEGARSRPLTFI